MSGIVNSIGNAVSSIATVAVPAAAAYFTGGATLGLGAVASGALAGAAAGAVSTAINGGSVLNGALAGGLLGGAGGAIAGIATGTPLFGAANATATVGDVAAGLQAANPSLYPNAGAAMTQAEALVAAGQTPAQIMTGMGYAPGTTFATNAAGVTMAQTPAGAGTGMISSGGVKDTFGNLISSSFGSPNFGGLLSQGLAATGQYLNSTAAKDAASTNALAQIQAAQIAADAAKFRPVGVTTNFGSSKFGYDASGNLNSAGYTLAPQIQNQQNALMGLSDVQLAQYMQSPVQTAPMSQAANSMMTLGNQYLQTSPQAQAQQYMTEQQNLLAGSRASDLASLQNNLQQTGRAGLSVGGGGGMVAANPEMQAYYNALNQQNLGLAAQATQGGQQYAQYGANMVGAGGTMLDNMYRTQSNAYNPYATSINGANGLEKMGQNAMTLGTSVGSTSSNAAAQAGQYMSQGMQNAANLNMGANMVSTTGQMLSGLSQNRNLFGA